MSETENIAYFDKILMVDDMTANLWVLMDLLTGRYVIEGKNIL